MGLQAKKVMSANAQAPLSVECIMNDVDVRGMISRDEFEAMAQPILQRALPTLQQVSQVPLQFQSLLASKDPLITNMDMSVIRWYILLSHNDTHIKTMTLARNSVIVYTSDSMPSDSFGSMATSSRQVVLQKFLCCMRDGAHACRLPPPPPPPPSPHPVRQGVSSCLMNSPIQGAYG